MADQTDVHIGENSPEEVAYKLLSIVRRMETGTATKKQLLDTYAECLMAVRRPEARAPG
jgi:hypothetical protein